MAEEVSEHATDLKSGPFSVLYRAVSSNTQVLVNLRNNHKLLARVKAYDRHMNLLLEDVKEMWTEASKGGKGKARGAAINKDRYVSKMFLRGDSVILIVSNPAAALNGGGGGGAASKAGGKESRSEEAAAAATATSGGGDDQ